MTTAKTGKKRAADLSAASSLRDPMQISAQMERLSLEDFMSRCTTQECGEMTDDMVTRLKTESPGLSLPSLRHCALSANIDERLTNACIERLNWRQPISAGASYCLAILDDGGVVGWGNDGQKEISGGTTALPAGRRYVSVNADRGSTPRMKRDGTKSSGYHSIGLLDNGDIVEWGSMLRTTQGGVALVPALPAGRRYVSVTSGEQHALALRDDGEIVGWGDNTDGQLDVAPLPTGRKYVGVSAGSQWSLGLRDNGEVVGWGSLQLLEPQLQTGKVWRGPYVQVVSSADPDYSLALLDSGMPVTWGSSMVSATQAARGALESGAVGEGRRLVSVSAGSQHAVGLLDNGQAVAWGSDTRGQASEGTGELERRGWRDFVAVSAAGSYSMGLRESGTVVIWGSALSIKPGAYSPPAGRKFAW